MKRFALLFLVLICGLAPVQGLSEEIVQNQFENISSGHQYFLELHKDTPPAFETRQPESYPIKGAWPFVDQVLGFYPYWVSQTPSSLRWDLINVVAFFSLEINQYGNFTNYHGWPHGDLVDQAHQNGRRAIVTITNFSSSQIGTLLGSSTNRANAISNIVDQVVLGGADGVSIDFEGVPSSAKNNFVTFMSELKSALTQELGNPYITICSPAIDWNGSYDYDQLAANSSYLMIMAYDYHYRGGDPGPTAPLHGGAPWSNWMGIDYTLDDYEAYITPYTLRKVIVGLPFYGYDWPTTSSSVPGTATANGTAIFMSSAIDRVDSGNYGPLHYDTASDTPYLVYYSGGWHQHFFDDADSLGLRFAYAKSRSTGGVGFWALGYEGDYDEVWDAVADHYGDDDDDTVPDDDDDTVPDDDDTVPDDDDDTAPDDDDDDDSGTICGQKGAGIFDLLF